MKISRTVIYLVLLISVFFLIKYFFLNTKDSTPSGQQMKAVKAPVSITVIKTRELDNKITATGRILSQEEVVLMSEISGRIERIFFKEGTFVEKGELLVKIKNDDLSAQFNKTAAELKLAREMETRGKKLLEINGVSQEEYDILFNRVKTLIAELEYNTAQLDKSIIKAPFSGQIGLKNVSEGSFVTPSLKIATLQQTNPVKIDFSIPEKHATGVRKGDKIHFTVAGTDSIFKGSIYAIEPGIDPVTRTLPLRAMSDNKGGHLIPGSFAKIELVMNTIKDAIMIPTQALIPELKGQKVFIIKNGKATTVKVKTGMRSETEVQITDGLFPGDSLVTAGFMQLRPEQEVIIVK